MSDIIPCYMCGDDSTIFYYNTYANIVYKLGEKPAKAFIPACCKHAIDTHSLPYYRGISRIEYIASEVMGS